MCATAFVVEFPPLVAPSEARVTPRHHTSGKSFFPSPHTNEEQEEEEGWGQFGASLAFF